MKRILLAFCAGIFLAPQAHAYDEALAKTYEQFFASFEEQLVPKAMHLVPPDKLVEAIKKGEDMVLLDVRTLREQSIVALSYPNSLSMPMNEVFKPENLAKIPTDKKVIVTCQTGVRCMVIATALRNIGFDNVYASKGGLAALINYLGPQTAFPQATPPPQDMPPARSYGQPGLRPYPPDYPGAGHPFPPPPGWTR